MAFRRKECGQESVTVNLQGIIPGGQYVFEDADGGTARTSVGGEFKITLPEKGSSGLWFYESDGKGL
ncbi:MAG TPA: hypothetical protein PK854_10200 [Oscillospiraceae bacterium]|nr:hypothetical protein [Oscillospiraceae bacterium]HPS35624.1 hypothetical protein [Oscillospiraceae bacterium]